MISPEELKRRSELRKIEKETPVLTKIHPRKSGVPVLIFAAQEQKDEKPSIYVLNSRSSMCNCNPELIPIEFSERPHLDREVRAKLRFDDGLLYYVYKWMALNENVLRSYWNRKIDASTMKKWLKSI